MKGYEKTFKQREKEFLDSALGRSNEFSKTRSDNVRRDKDSFSRIKVGLYEIDETILNHIKNKLNPRIIVGEEYVEVPVLMATPERWASIRNGGYRDVQGKLLLPLIAIKRVSIEDDSEYPIDKLDANNPNIFYPYYSKPKRFRVYGGRVSEFFGKRCCDVENLKIRKEIKDMLDSVQTLNVIMPEYIVVNYEVLIWTEFISQMNGLIEIFKHSSKSYYGDRMRFRVVANNFSNMFELSSESDRAVKTTFNLQVKAYLISDEYARQIAGTSTSGNLYHSKKIVMNERIL